MQSLDGNLVSQKRKNEGRMGLRVMNNEKILMNNERWGEAEAAREWQQNLKRAETLLLKRDLLQHPEPL